MDYFLLKLILFTGFFNYGHGVIEWAANGAVSAAAGAVTSGASMLQSLAMTPNYRVVCTVEIENWTKYPLLYPESHINGGIVRSPPVAVQPGQKEMFIVHKTGYTASGTYGTASWLISGQSKRAVVMWSCPFNFDYNSNWLGVGLTDSGVTSHQDWFSQMYYDSSIWDMKFARGEYYYNTRTLSVKDRKFEITGIMGTSHRAKAHIIVRPLLATDLANSIKLAVDK